MKIKTIGKRFLQVLLTLLILLVLLFLALLIHHQMTKVSADDFLPKDAQAYIEIDSFKNFYSDVIDLKALEIILSQDELNTFFYSILDYKNNEYSQSFLFQEALNLKTSIILNDDFSPSFIIDPGLKGILTRHLPYFFNRIKNEKIETTTSLMDGETVYTFAYNQDKQYHILIRENLILLALNKDHLKVMLYAEKSGEGMVTRNQLEKIEAVSVKNSILNLFLRTDEFLSTVLEKESSTGKLLSMIDFPSLSSISLALSNTDINVKASAQIIAKTELMKDFLGYNASPLGVIRILPDSTNVYTSVNFKSFKDLYGIISTLQDDFVLEDYDSLLKLISGLKSDDILFSWTGSEAGLFTIETAPEPVVFVKISEEETLMDVLSSLDSSLLLNINDTLIIDSIRINQFSYPDIIKAGMTFAKKSTELPYFITYKDYLFLSMNPENLAQMIRKERAGELLVKEKTYKSITARIPQNANFFFYYDLNSALPRFITRSDLMTQLLREYEKGVISLFYTEDKVLFNLSAKSSDSNRTSLFPGYPKKTKGIISPVIVADISGGDSKELIYLNEDYEVTINDITNKQLSSLAINNEAALTLLPEKEIFINDTEGVLYKIDGEGTLIDPFPRFSAAKDSFPPLLTHQGLIMYSSLDKQIQHYDLTGKLLNSIDAEKTVFSRPLLIDDRLYYYPKSLLGDIFSHTISGKEVKGWPQSAMGVSFTTPFRFKKSIGFLTQKGGLHLWDSEGRLIDGFPVELNGVYYATPVVLNHPDNLIAAISHDGLVSLVSEKGEIVSTRYFENMTGKDVKLTVADPEESDSQLLFIYGGSNYMIAANRNLQILPGFPVKGYTRPYFSDINNDGFTEIISAGYDKYLYIYTLRNE